MDISALSYAASDAASARIFCTEGQEVAKQPAGDKLMKLRCKLAPALGDAGAEMPRTRGTAHLSTFTAGRSVRSVTSGHSM